MVARLDDLLAPYLAQDWPNLPAAREQLDEGLGTFRQAVLAESV